MRDGQRFDGLEMMMTDYMLPFYNYRRYFEWILLIALFQVLSNLWSNRLLEGM